MSRAKDTPLTAQAARAIDRVLSAEREAVASLEQARLQAAQELERAREDALVQVNRAMDRIAVWQRTHAQAMQRRQAGLREQAAALGVGLRELDAAALTAAVQVVAARLCGGAEGAPEPGSGAGSQHG